MQLHSNKHKYIHRSKTSPTLHTNSSINKEDTAMEVNTGTTSFNISIKEVEVEDITKAEVEEEVKEDKEDEENFGLSQTPTSIAGPMEAAITLATS
eukprot:2103781-Ditylum_brightwellii.AAC.1